MDKQNVVYTYNAVLFNPLEREILTHTTTWMNLGDMMLTEYTGHKKTVFYNPNYMRHLELSNPYRQKV